MAVPGRVDWKVAAGCNQLIREGARLVTCVDDIIEELTPLGKESRGEGKKKASATGERRATADKRQPAAEARRAATDAPQATFTLEESLVLRAIPEGGATIDMVAREAKLPMEKVNALLVGLRLKGRVRFLPGNRVALAG